MRYLLIIIILLVVTPLPSCGEDDSLTSAVCIQPCYAGDIETIGVGVCRSGQPVCENNEIIFCDGEVLPGEEMCDNLDNDCNGEIDDYVRDEGIWSRCGSDIGECSSGNMLCIDGNISCQGEELSSEEVCDGLDNDCNGFVDDLEIIGLCYEGDWDNIGYGECSAGVYLCEEGDIICARQRLPEEEVCDGLDNDCDGFVDEELNEGESVDIVFILDRSGSMVTHFSSVANASRLFATNFAGVPEFRFALVGIPHAPGTHAVEVLLDFTDAATFVATLGTMFTTGGVDEASYDAPYLASNGNLGLSWGEGDVRKYIVLFTDEPAQSYRTPQLTEVDVTDELISNDITFYGFIKWQFNSHFDDIATGTGGAIYPLGTSSMMEEDLAEIFADECW
jgi:hypothetical protein